MYEYDSSGHGSNRHSGFEIGINRFVQGGVVTAHVAREGASHFDDGVYRGSAQQAPKTKFDRIAPFIIGISIVIGFAFIVMMVITN